MINRLMILLLLVSIPIFAITLKRAKYLAVENAASIKMMKESVNIEGINITKQEKYFQQNPELSSSFTHNEGSLNTYQVSISQRFDLGNQSYFRKNIALKSYQIQNILLAKTKRNITARIENIFISVWVNKEKIFLLNKIISYEQKVKDNTSEKIKLGLSPKGDIFPILLDLAKYKAQRNNLKYNIEAKRLSLEQYVKKNIQTIDTTFKKNFAPINQKNIKSKINNTYKIKIIDQKIQRMRYKLEELQKNKNLSYINVNAGYTKDAGENKYSLGFSIPLNISNKTDQNIAIALKNISRLSFQRNKIKNKILSNLFTKYKTIESLELSREIYKKEILPSLEIYLNNAKIRYENGEIPIEVFESAVQKYIQTNISYIDFERDILKNKIEIKKILGENL